MKEKWKPVALWGGMGIVALWTLTPVLVGFYAPLFKDGVSTLGSTGDMFGAVSALFNGLAFLAIIVVLVYEMGERKKDLTEVSRLTAERLREMRPFVVPTAVKGGFRLSRGEWDDHEFACDLSAEFVLANATGDVAINVLMSTSLESIGSVDVLSIPSVESRVDLPLSGLATCSVRPTFSLRGENAASILRALTNRSPIGLSLRVEYAALNGVSWNSVVTYRAELDGDGPTRVGHILAKNPDYYIKNSAGGRPLVFDTSCVPGSWAQGDQ
jgi:hypothetical protein